MLMNNLDPEVAERPGRSRRLRRHRARRRAAGRRSTRSCASLQQPRERRDAARAVGQARRRVPHARRARRACSSPTPTLVPHWATWETFRELEAHGLTMYGQMTAGSWIYIGTQGILQGTYETFAALARRHFGGSLAGRLGRHRRPGRHGRRPAAGRDDERRRRPRRRGRSGAASSAGSRHGYLDAGRRSRSTRRSRWLTARTRDEDGAARSALRRQRRRRAAGAGRAAASCPTCSPIRPARTTRSTAMCRTV